MTKWLKNLINWVSKFLVKASLLPTEEKSVEMLPIFTVETLYVNSEIGLNVRSLPDVTSEKIGAIPHGTEVSVLNEQEKWFEIKSGDLQGWVSSVYLVEEKPIERKQRIIKEDVMSGLPQFKIAVANFSGDINTIKLRKIINYEFNLDFDKDELQCTEYAQYRIQQMGIKIQWPVRANRNGGNWANIFEKHGSYKVLNQPKAGCAMCFTTGFRTLAMNAIGHVAFVEQVFDDESVRITEANWPRPGKYNERIVPISEWRDKYKCRFVDFS